MAFKQVHCCLCCSSSNGGGGGGLMISIFVLLLLKFVALGGCANGQFVKYIKFCSPRWHFLNFLADTCSPWGNLLSYTPYRNHYYKIGSYLTFIPWLSMLYNIYKS